MTKNPRTRILLHACPRCQGDLFPDYEEEELTCLQCGRTVTFAQVAARLTEHAKQPELAKVA